MLKKTQENKQKKKDYLKEKDNLQIFTFKECLRQLLFLEIVSVTKVKNKLIYVCVKSGGGGRSN